MDVAVIGGTGTVGREVVAQLAARGHRPLVLSRRPPEGGDAEQRPVDLAAGEGLGDALSGVDALVDAAQGGRDVLVDGVRRAPPAAASCRCCASRSSRWTRARSQRSSSTGSRRARRARSRRSRGRRSSGSTGSRVRGRRPTASAACRSRSRPRGGVLRAVRHGGLTDEAAPRGTVAFDAWLARTA